MMAFSCAADHLAREINTYTARWPKRGQQVAHAAADFQHVLSWIDEVSVNLLEAAVIPPAHAAPGVTLARYGIPMRHARLLIDVPGLVKRRNDVHNRLIVRGGGQFGKVQQRPQILLLHR